MGFGLILPGLLSLLMFRLVPVELFGFAAAYKGLDKLSVYGKDFVRAKYASAAIVAFSAVDAVLWLCKVFSLADISDTVLSVLNTVHTVLVAVFLVLLSLALCSIAKKCGYAKGEKRARFGIIFTAVYVVSLIIGAIVPSAAAVPMFFSILLYLYYPYTVYGFYMMIVTDDIIEKERIALEVFDKRFGPGRKKK